VAVMIQHLTFALAFLQPSSKKAFAELGDLKSAVGASWGQLLGLDYRSSATIASSRYRSFIASGS